MLATALYDWRETQDNDLFVSMEMSALAICKRIGAMYTHVPVKQLQVAGFSTHTFDVFCAGLDKMSDEKGNLYVVDGNLAANVDDIYALAAALNCKKIWIDGGYLVRHPNPRLNRYERVAENTETMKKRSADDGLVTSVSWQFARDAVKKNKQGNGTTKVKPSLEDIGYSDVIGQASSLVFGLMQEDSVETLLHRIVDVLKGRDGQIGQWRVNWRFDTMDFSQYVEAEASSGKDTFDFV
jgi:replicative DNA helicase